MFFVVLAFLMMTAEVVDTIHEHHQQKLINGLPSTPIPDCGGTPCTDAQSWDQENLKAKDKGCPTSVWVAPGGNLEQCL